MPKQYRFDIEQRSDEWREAKLGKFSGSDFHIFLGKSQTREDALWEKIAERMFKDSDKENFTTFAMERGVILEAEARRLYSALTETAVQEVGLVVDRGKYDGWVVCSPDGLVGEDGIIEIKCPLAKNYLHWTKVEDDVRVIDYIKPEYITQVQFNLMVTNRQWCDFIYYHPRAGGVVKRIEPDAEYQKKIREALDRAIEFITENGGK